MIWTHPEISQKNGYILYEFGLGNGVVVVSDP